MLCQAWHEDRFGTNVLCGGQVSHSGHHFSPVKLGNSARIPGAGLTGRSLECLRPFPKFRSLRPPKHQDTDQGLIAQEQPQVPSSKRCHRSIGLLVSLSVPFRELSRTSVAVTFAYALDGFPVYAWTQSINEGTADCFRKADPPNGSGVVRMCRALYALSLAKVQGDAVFLAGCVYDHQVHENLICHRDAIVIIGRLAMPMFLDDRLMMRVQ